MQRSADRRQLAAAPTVELDGWTFDALFWIAETRGVSMERVLDEMLRDWKPGGRDVERACRRPMVHTF